MDAEDRERLADAALIVIAAVAVVLIAAATLGIAFRIFVELAGLR